MTGTVQYLVSSLQTCMLAPVCAGMFLEITNHVWLNGHRVTDSAGDYLETSVWRVLELPLCASFLEISDDLAVSADQHLDTSVRS